MKFNVKNLFMGVVLIIVLAVVFLRGDQLVELGETMKQGSPLPLVAAILTQLGKYFAQSFAYSRSFAAVGERMEPKSTLPLVFGTFFMNTIAPSMNLAGTTLVVDDARRRGIPAGKATGAALLMQITIDGAFSTLMVCAFIFLAVTVGLSPVWFLMGMVVLCLVGTMVALLILAHKKPGSLMRLLRPVERVSRKVVGRVRKKPLEPWAERIAQAFSEAAGMIGHSPKPTLQAYGCSLIASLCELSCFALVGIGFGVDTAPALVCGYVVATLFAMISVTPQGVGVVEAAVVVAFTSFGESAAAGTAIGLVYRGIVFWMPFIIGAVLINTTKAFKGDVKQAAYTNCLNNGIKRILPGLRNLDVSDLEAGGLNTQQLRGYTFKEGSKGGAGKSAAASGLTCSNCNSPVTQAEASYSEGKYGRRLCRACGPASAGRRISAIFCRSSGRAGRLGRFMRG